MGWGSFLTSVADAASGAAKATARVIADSATAAAEHWIDEKVAQYNTAKTVATLTYKAGVVAKDYAVQQAVAGYDYTKQKVVEGAIATKDAAIAVKDAALAGAGIAVGSVERVAIEARYLEALGPSEVARRAFESMKSALGAGDAGCATQPCPRKVAECAKLQDAYEKAILAKHAYQTKRKKSDNGTDADTDADNAGYHRLNADNAADLAELKKFLATNDPKTLLEDKNTDFSATVFRRMKNGKPEYVVSYRGTQGELTGPNWRENGKQATGQINPTSTDSSYVKAMNLAYMAQAGAKQQGATLSFVGHSLGGGMASAAAVATGLPANTYNAAGLHANTTPHGYPDPPADVEAYYTPTDFLSATQDHRKIMLGGAIIGAGALNPAAGQALGAVVVANELGDTPLAPRAYGNRRIVPFPPKRGLTPIGLTEGHDMPLVIEGIEAEQDARGCK